MVWQVRREITRLRAAMLWGAQVLRQRTTREATVAAVAITLALKWLTRLATPLLLPLLPLLQLLLRLRLVGLAVLLLLPRQHLLSPQ